jgi:excisionase family DNA binding protein
VNPEPLLTARQIADLLGMSPATILDWFEADRIPGFKLPTGPVRFRATEVEAWFEAHRRGPCDPAATGVQSGHA